MKKMILVLLFFINVAFAKEATISSIDLQGWETLDGANMEKFVTEYTSPTGGEHTKYIMHLNKKLSVIINLNSKIYDKYTVKELKELIDKFSKNENIINVIVEYKKE